MRRRRPTPTAWMMRHRSRRGSRSHRGNTGRCLRLTGDIAGRFATGAVLKLALRLATVQPVADHLPIWEIIASGALRADRRILNRFAARTPDETLFFRVQTATSPIIAVHRRVERPARPSLPDRARSIPGDSTWIVQGMDSALLGCRDIGTCMYGRPECILLQRDGPVSRRRARMMPAISRVR